MIDWKTEIESARCDAFDAEFPYWQDGEMESDSERFVSEYDMENDEFEKGIEFLNLMDANEFARYADNLEREREIMRDMEGWM